MEVIQDRAEFSDNESILVQESGSYIKKDIRIVEYRDDYIKTDGYDNLKVGDRFIGNVSGTAANVTGITNRLSSTLISQAEWIMVGMTILES